MQSPENQIVTDKVWHELAFGLESLGIKTPEIRLRVAEMASFFGIQTWFHKPVTELSGGQKQILALASIMVLQPSVLILDEPTSQLDPIAASEFLEAVRKINQELGLTVLLTEHRLEEAMPLASRAIVMDNGKIISDDIPTKVGLGLRGQNNKMFLAMPTPMRVWSACNDYTKDKTDDKTDDKIDDKTDDKTCPITVRDGAIWLEKQSVDSEKIPKEIERNTDDLELAISLDEVWFRYEKNMPDVLKGVSFKGYYGEITAILGGNGTGKTTMLSLVAGLYKPHRGKIHTSARAYSLPQNPQALFTSKTVKGELLETAGGKSAEEKDTRIMAIAKLCKVEDLLTNHPYDLSGGEQQRVALAKVLLLEPKILLLDEPTKGLDAEFKQIFASILRQLARAGTAVIIVSHDVEFCAEHAERCALFFDGSIVTENTPRKFFSNNSFYTTCANRMAREKLPIATTANDVILALGGKLPPAPKFPNDVSKTTSVEQNKSALEKLPEGSKSSSPRDIQSREVRLGEGKRSKLPKRTIAASALILLGIPLTIFIGIYLFDDRRFYFISLLIVLQTMLPFALVFESRKPQARELVIIAVLCAIAVAGRMAFFMLPQFKPAVAIIIIAGIAFGAESGFLVGALTAFVSNMFFGHGPWTPWQMFAFGIIGFLAGILFQKGLLSRKTISLAIFGGLATFFIYGGILNPASVLIAQPNPTLEMFVAYYIQAIPFDLTHAAATVLFLAIIAKPMLEKLERIKVKYGLIQ
jgi:energy-coupling factor transport system ATP-binding protein